MGFSSSQVEYSGESAPSGEIGAEHGHQRGHGERPEARRQGPDEGEERLRRAGKVDVGAADDGQIFVDHYAFGVQNARLIFIEAYACRQQVAGLSCGREVISLSEDLIKTSVDVCVNGMPGSAGASQLGQRDWPALLRKLERERGASYRT